MVEANPRVFEERDAEHAEAEEVGGDLSPETRCEAIDDAFLLGEDGL